MTGMQRQLRDRMEEEKEEVGPLSKVTGSCLFILFFIILNFLPSHHLLSS
jgi:hypothetical protein